MNCALFRKHMQSYLDSELDAAACLEMDVHFESCPNCQVLAGLENRFRAEFKSAMSLRQEMPEGLEERLQQTLAHASGNSGMFGRHQWHSDRATKMRYWASTSMLAAAASVLLVTFGGDVQRGDVRPSSVERAGLSLGRDIHWLHNKKLPADVVDQKNVSAYFKDKVPFVVQPVNFAGQDQVQFSGARFAKVGNQPAATMYYNVGGRRITVVAAQGQASDLQSSSRISLGNQPVYRVDRNGRLVVLEKNGVSYTFAGDLDSDELARLVSSAQMK